MTGEHISDLLERLGMQGLTERDRETIDAHVAGCSSCRDAYRAARVADKLLEARMSDSADPPAFFSTRVMAALRERQADQVFSFAAMWKAGRVLVTTLVMVVTVLFALTVYIGRSEFQASDNSADDDIYSTEWAILDGGNDADDITDSQLMTTLYESPDADGQDN